MYFRFPILLLLILTVSFGVVYLTTRFQDEAGAVPASSPEPAPVVKDVVDVSEAEMEALARIQASRLEGHVHFLADDLLEGRDTGTRGTELAAHYIASQFRGLGLRPAGSGESYFQPVTLFRRQVAESTQLSVQVDGEWIELKYGTDFLAIDAREAQVEGELLFTGFGITAPEYEYDDYEGLDVEGKVTIYLTGEPASDDDEYFAGEAPS